MGRVYRCERCGREFIIDNEDIVPERPDIKLPYCPYCGDKVKMLGWDRYEFTVSYVRDND